MKLRMDFFKINKGSFKILAIKIFAVLFFIILTTKGQFGRFSFWGTRGSGDSVAPTCSINSEPTLSSGWIKTSSASYTFTCTDNVALSRVECNLNSTGWANCDSTTAHTLNGLTNTAANNSNLFQIRAFDTSGNVSSVVSATQFGVDLDGPNAPTISITGTDTLTIHISVSATDIGSSGVTGNYYYSFDQGTPSYSLSILSDYNNNFVGTVYFRIYATDNAGNNGAVSVTSWTNGNWSAWSACGGACGAGGGTQSRTCDNPAPSTSPAGKNCAGSSSQSCNQGVTSNNSANMCSGYKYFVKYTQTYCPTATPCPGTITSDSGNVILLCNVPWTPGSVNCDGGSYYPANTTFSCESGSASITYSNSCGSMSKSSYLSVYECTCN